MGPTLCLMCACAAPVDTRAPRMGDEGEGEGAASEGEGEGDASEGEGEGDAGEGEGEGDAGEGEGEGDAGEGEGEGEGEACAAGFTGSPCAPLGISALTSRAEQDVCAHWANEFQDVFPEWEPTPGVNDACDVGVVSQAALDNGARRLNLYRWLVGVPDVSLDAGLFAQQQGCAVQMAALGYLTHAPTSEMSCYTPEGAAGAGSSNISGGGGLAYSVDNYIWDGGNETHFGHRRWVLGPYMSVTQFGVKNGFSCMYSFSLGGSADPDYVAYPPPGYVPVGASQGEFTFTSQRFAPNVDTRVELAMGDGPFTETASAIAEGNYGHWGMTISFAKNGAGDLSSGALWHAGTVRVRIIGTSGGDVEYTIVFTDCP